MNCLWKKKKVLLLSAVSNDFYSNKILGIKWKEKWVWLSGEVSIVLVSLNHVGRTHLQHGGSRSFVALTPKVPSELRNGQKILEPSAAVALNSQLLTSSRFVLYVQFLRIGTYFTCAAWRMCTTPYCWPLPTSYTRFYDSIWASHIFCQRRAPWMCKNTTSHLETRGRCSWWEKMCCTFSPTCLKLGKWEPCKHWDILKTFSLLTNWSSHQVYKCLGYGLSCSGWKHLHNLPILNV